MNPILILSPRFTPDSTALWRAALAAGWSVERLQSHRAPDWLREQDFVIYGEALFANVIAEQLSVALLEPPFSWVADLPYVYRQREIRYTTLGEARKSGGPAFVKPAYDKSFDARVYDSGHELPTAEALPDELTVLISEPVSWQVEFRAFVLNRSVQTISVYVRGGELAQTDDGDWPASSGEIQQAIDFTTMLLNDQGVSIPPAFVLDVGKLSGRGLAVVEANPAWASGIYGCDPTHILSVIQRACVKQDQLSEDDRRWVWERPI